jgi:hypothetical protein
MTIGAGRPNYLGTRAVWPILEASTILGELPTRVGALILAGGTTRVVRSIPGARTIRVVRWPLHTVREESDGLV